MTRRLSGADTLRRSSCALVVALLDLACAPQGADRTPEPPAVARSSPSSAPLARSPAPAPRQAGDAAAPRAEPTTAPEAPLPVEPAVQEARLTDDSGAPLPQTEDRPTVDSPLFRAHVEALFAAIVADDPAVALKFFFPLLAYEQVKDVQRPAVDWQRRLVTAFERNVHEYHRAMGKHAAGATLVSLEVPEARVQWMKPGQEGNRIGYHRVLRSRLRWRDAEGRERDFEVTSLISWRGEWYVVHLHGFE